MRETQRVSHKQQISGPKPGDYELGSLESRAAARAMHDAQAAAEDWKRILNGERADGEVVRVFMGEQGQVLRTEAKRGGDWVRVEDEPKPVRITGQIIRSGNVLLIGGPPPDMAPDTATPVPPSHEQRRESEATTKGTAATWKQSEAKPERPQFAPGFQAMLGGDR